MLSQLFLVDTSNNKPAVVLHQTPANKMKKYLLYLAQSHPNFRKAELESLADLYGIKVDLSNHNENSPFMIVELENDEQAKKLVKRAVLAKAIYELWGHGDDLEKMHEDVKRNKDKLVGRFRKSRFKFVILQYQGKKKTRKQQTKIMDSFQYLGLEGKIDLENPEEKFTVLETYTIQKSNLEPRPEPDHCWFGRLVQLSVRSDGIVDMYEIAKRPYYGTTTFESELSLVTCNLAQVRDGAFIYDPFVGTGSFLLASAYFGGYVFGSDIDFLTLKGGRPGKKNIKNLKDDFEYYGTHDKFGDVICMDFTNCALRKDMKIDTIVCDPPYGIREGVKVCGTTNVASAELTKTTLIEGQHAFLRKDYVQPKKSVSLDFMLDDLLQFAADRLPVGGRLCFWMPAANDADIPTLIPQHQRLELIHTLVQQFNKWSRRLLVYVKRDEHYNGKTVTREERAHKNNFRERYFSQFS